MNAQQDSKINILPSNHEVESRARALLRTACENVDSYHALRLGLARRKALHAGPAGAFARSWTVWAGAAAASCALVVAVVLIRPATRTGPITDAAAPAPIAAAAYNRSDDLPDIDSSQMEMVQDLDFYRWLASQPAVDSAPNGGTR